MTWDQCRDIAEQKLEDLNATDLDNAARMIAGTARSMGLTVTGAGMTFSGSKNSARDWIFSTWKSGGTPPLRKGWRPYPTRLRGSMGGTDRTSGRSPSLSIPGATSTCTGRQEKTAITISIRWAETLRTAATVKIRTS